MPILPSADDFRACFAAKPVVVSTSAGPVEYAERGTGEPVLAVHGSFGGWDQGLVGAEFLRRHGFRVIAPSRPGYLGTPLSTGQTFSEQGDALAALLDALGIERVHVFAASGGGPAGYELASRHPGKVRSLVQLDGVCIPGRIPPGARFAATDVLTRVQLWLLRHATKPTLTAVFRSFGTETRRDAARRAAAIAADPQRLAPLEAAFRASLGARRRRQGLLNDLRPFAPAALDRITCPVLIVHGRGDRAVPPANAEYAHALIPDSELYWMDGSHVAFFLEAADTAPAYVVEWIMARLDTTNSRGRGAVE